MPIAGNNASVRTSDNTTTENVATASTPVEEGGVDDPSPTIDSAPTSDNTTTMNVASASTSTLVAEGGGLKERIGNWKVRLFY